MDVHCRIAAAVDLADQPGPETVNQGLRRQQTVVDLGGVSTLTVCRDYEAIRREVCKRVGHVGIVLQTQAQNTSHWSGDNRVTADARMH